MNDDAHDTSDQSNCAPPILLLAGEVEDEAIGPHIFRGTD